MLLRSLLTTGFVFTLAKAPNDDRICDLNIQARVERRTICVTLRWLTRREPSGAMTQRSDEPPSERSCAHSKILEHCVYRPDMP